MSDILHIKNTFFSFEELFDKEGSIAVENINFLEGKTILVTGGAGSIGSQIVQQLLKQKIKKIIVIDNNEYGLFKLNLQYQQEITEQRIELELSDLKNRKRIEEIFNKFKIDIVYHAAAYKHVKILEDNWEESISNNVTATEELLNLSIQYKIETFIFISTDKAVNPINNLGISKRLAELSLLKKILDSENNIEIKIVRFGNVFNSSGSLFEILKYNIEHNTPFTLTDERMNRYFISNFQAGYGLVLLSKAKYKNGIFILNMGKPYLISDLVKKVFDKVKPNSEILLKSNQQLNKEKISEELSFPFESVKPLNNFFSKLNYTYTQEIIYQEEKHLNKLIKNNYFCNNIDKL